MLLKIFHFLLNLAAVSLNCTNWFSFFICTQMLEYCHFPSYKAKKIPSMGTWQHCWDLYVVIVLLSSEVLTVPSQITWRKSWENHAAVSCEEKCWSQVLSMSEIMCFMSLPCVIGGIKYVRSTSQHRYGLPENVGAPLQFLKPGWVMRRDPIRCSVGTEPRIEIPPLGAEISKESLIFRIRLIERSHNKLRDQETIEDIHFVKGKNKKKQNIS